MSEGGEDPQERLNRELIELLNELRVTLPGVQVLFAFLLAVPFTNRFTRLTDLQRDVFFASLVCTMIGTALLIAPSAYHRLRWRQHDKEQMLRTSNRLSIAGTVALAGAMTTAMFVISDVLYDSTLTAFFTAATAAIFAWFWYGLPLMRRLQDNR